MKKSLILFAFSLLLFACGSQGNKTESSKTEDEIATIDPASLETIEIVVIGMTCGGCESTVQKAVGKLSGVQSVKASHSDSTALVTFDPGQIAFEAMKAAIIDKGYAVGDYSVIETSK
jgi:copper chaperone CopZ